uniref:1 4-alpha-glucan-branching enzyme 3ic/amyloplastic isoform X2 n=1 Tax=Rhizophora mucronata TaxID=61149 RepID=A0A2P2LZC1_RHIMU
MRNDFGTFGRVLFHL